jgi:lia operon protein LiaG
MKVMFGIILIVIGAFLLVTTISSPFTNSKTKHNEGSLTTDISSVKSLDLSSTSVDWVIEGHDGEMLSVELVNQNKQIELHSNEQKETLQIVVKEPRFRFFSFNFLGKTKAIVRIPNSYSQNLNVNSISGEIVFHDELSVNNTFSKTVSGNVLGSTLSSESVEVKTTSGNIKFKEVTATDVRLESVSGDLIVQTLSGDIEGKTVSGNIEIEYRDENDKVWLKTVSGDVELFIPIGNAEVNVSTVSGDVHLDLQQQQSIKSRSYTGILGDGLHPLRISTTSGDIRIRER